MLNYDQKKDLKNKSETLSIKCVQRLEEKNSCVTFPNPRASSDTSRLTAVWTLGRSLGDAALRVPGLRDPNVIPTM